MAFRFEMTFPDGRPMVVFEAQKNLDTGAWALVTTFCDTRVSAEVWRAGATGGQLRREGGRGTVTRYW